MERQMKLDRQLVFWETTEHLRQELEGPVVSLRDSKDTTYFNLTLRRSVLC